MSSKKSKLRLYGDENIPLPSVIYLKSKGISIKHAYDFNLIEIPDKEHLQKSKRLNRILISLDKDVKKFEGIIIEDHPGVILLSTGDITPPHLNKLLDKVVKYIIPSYAKDSLLRVTMNKITKVKQGMITEKNIE